jgi:hypothetical protein
MTLKHWMHSFRVLEMGKKKDSRKKDSKRIVASYASALSWARFSIGKAARMERNA